MFQKILIANRGEIACRIIRTAHKMGITCVAVYSEADAHALHVKLADEAYCIGPAPSRESYLRGDVIIATALKAGAQAIHPGYGFLSENAEFAEQCQKSNLCFIGPPAAAIRAMGSKSAAKQIMAQAKVPLVPGYHDAAVQDVTTLKKSADKIGYPVLLKAAAGGGGKGMRIVWQANDFAEALSSAQREAQNSFGNSEILIEKYLTKPRHIEIQVFADQHGNAVHLFERDCSIQRRHQKIIEEAPAPHFSDELREKMGATAITAAQAIGYVGAGTIEFLFDEDGAFYFMEMNTRLQVEHPITELITQQDLVEWQLRVAAGEPLPLTQQQLKIHGHAIETRVYAEDPLHDFLPSTGTIKFLQTPPENGHVRIDTGIVQGDEISPYYDPMLAKLAVWGENRTAAVQVLKQALDHYQIVGVTTNLNLLNKIAEHPAYIQGELDTGFINKHQQDLLNPIVPTAQVFAIASLYILQQQKFSAAVKNSNSPWFSADSWRLNLPPQQSFRFMMTEGSVAETKLILTSSTIIIETKINSEISQFTAAIPEKDCLHNLMVNLNDQQIKATVFVENNIIYILINGARYQLNLLSNDVRETEENTEAATHLTAPMPGKVVAILAETGKPLERGAGLIVVEAMKMEHTIYAPSAGTVKEWFFKVGDLVNEGVELLDFEAVKSS